MLFMVNYACGFNQSKKIKTEEIFWMNNNNVICSTGKTSYISLDDDLKLLSIGDLHDGVIWLQLP